ncbi:HAD-like domain-containing protein [Naematelia encephala]|uniref:HAD-like domain-containing protein n=1 Tax=Naematelia encephala TaxID=71784 RepID=A0A1Y2ARS6_9TREE|nr:HAD-like domain-containing protein [Naematelia encephala]
MSQPKQLPEALQGITSLTFDLMGTCADWLTSIINALSLAPPIAGLDHDLLARDWRAGFFKYILDSFARGEQSPDIDIVHREVLDGLLADRGVGKEWGEEVRATLVGGWHRQVGWPDAVEGIQRLRKKYDVVVLANGTTRLQLDIASSSGLPFHALLSSQLLGHTKPDQRMYLRCLDLLDRNSQQVAMVAAHAYDLRAAAKVGMRTIYIHRDTEDPEEDFEQLRTDVDLLIDGRAAAGPKGGLIALAELLGC